MLDLTTPALLLAYTNRFLALAALIRQFHAKYTDDPTCVVMGQIQNLRRRIRLIQFM
ncbi:MAG: DUF2721 domain-containing protein [Spirochaetaceae bacterium]|nr:DUF2721 domain-containing protein [Spirochaetaceae bacterium]